MKKVYGVKRGQAMFVTKSPSLCNALANAVAVAKWATRRAPDEVNLKPQAYTGVFH